MTHLALRMHSGRGCPTCPVPSRYSIESLAPFSRERALARFVMVRAHATRMAKTQSTDEGRNKGGSVPAKEAP